MWNSIATLEVVMHMAKLATDEHTKMGREASDRVEMRWGKALQSNNKGKCKPFPCDNQEGGEVRILLG